MLERSTAQIHLYTMRMRDTQPNHKGQLTQTAWGKKHPELQTKQNSHCTCISQLYYKTQMFIPQNKWYWQFWAMMKVSRICSPKYTLLTYFLFPLATWTMVCCLFPLWWEPIKTMRSFSNFLLQVAKAPICYICRISSFSHLVKSL